MAHDIEDPLGEPTPGRVARARAWSHGSRYRRLLWRSAVLVVGSALVLAGIAMLVLPGPGWAAIILGLVVLASEYAWAHYILSPIRRVADRAAEAALDPARRRRNLVIASVLTVLLAGLVVGYFSRYGFSREGLEWLPGL